MAQLIQPTNIGIQIMSNQSFLEKAVIGKADVTSYSVGKENGSTADEIQVTVIGDQLSYTGGYGNAILRMSGTKNLLSVIGTYSSNEYLLSKVVTSDMTGNEARESLMCDVLRKLASSH